MLRMMTILRFWFAVMLAFGLAIPAAATPPDVVTVRDEFFGANDTHIFVLRTSYDNMGSHYESRNEVFLVAIDLETAAEEYWPLYSVTQTTDFGEDGTDDEVIIKPDEDQEARNPYAILAERKALPWARFGQVWNAPEIETSPVGLTIIYGDGATYSLSTSAQSSRLTTSLQAITANITNHPRMSSVDTRQIFAELDMGLDHCKFTDPVRHYSYATEGLFQLIRMTCGDEDGLGGTSLIVPVPAVEQDSVEP